LKKELEDAILHSFIIREKAAEMQIEKGTLDTGMRSQVTSGKHLDKLTEVIAHDLEECGIAAEDIFCKNKGTELPGWFRAAKKWDILGLMKGQLVVGVEMKSIYSSYGNNLNNRAEEAIGSAVDAKYAIEKVLMNKSIPPIFGYVLIVKKENGSVAKCADPKEPHFKTDATFYDSSYIDRFMILCQRLSREGLYGAVWFVVADPLNGTVEELDPTLSYDRFIADIKGKVGSFSAGMKKNV
jgi:type II restriction enzyme